MQLSRRGSSAHHGTKTLELEGGTVSWHELSETLRFQKSRVPDFNTEANHDYTIAISPEDFGLLLECLAAKVAQGEVPESIQEALAHRMSFLVSLTSEIARSHVAR